MLLIEYTRKGQTINETYYTTVLDKVSVVLAETRLVIIRNNNKKIKKE